MANRRTQPSQSFVRHRIRLVVLLIFAPTILIVSGGCGRVINRTAERKIREALPEAIGPARAYRVHITNAGERTLQGKLSDVMVDGDDVQFPTGLLIDNLHLELKNVEVDTGRGRVRRIGSTSFVLTVLEKSLDEFIAGESPPGEALRNLRLILADNNYVTVTGDREVLGLGVPFRLTGPVRVASPTRIELDPTRLTVIGLPIGGAPLRFVKRKIESSVDLGALSVPLKLVSVQTQRGKLILAGTIDAQALLARAQAGK